MPAVFDVERPCRNRMTVMGRHPSTKTSPKPQPRRRPYLVQAGGDGA